LASLRAGIMTEIVARVFRDGFSIDASI